MSKTIHFRITDEEKLRLAELSEMMGMSVSEFVRYLVNHNPNLSDLKDRGKKNQVAGVRLDPTMMEKIKAMTEEQGMDVSTLLSNVVGNFLKSGKTMRPRKASKKILERYKRSCEKKLNNLEKNMYRELERFQTEAADKLKEIKDELNHWFGKYKETQSRWEEEHTKRITEIESLTKEISRLKKEIKDKECL